MSVVVVAGLLEPQAQVEIEATAVVDRAVTRLISRAELQLCREAPAPATGSSKELPYDLPAGRSFPGLSEAEGSSACRRL